MNVGHLEPGTLFQFKRQKRPEVYERLPDSEKTDGLLRIWHYGNYVNGALVPCEEGESNGSSYVIADRQVNVIKSTVDRRDEEKT